MITLFIICAIIWCVSFMLVCQIYSNKWITPTIWSILSALLPIVNTIIAIAFLPRCGFKEFIQELKEK